MLKEQQVRLFPQVGVGTDGNRRVCASGTDLVDGTIEATPGLHHVQNFVAMARSHEGLNDRHR
jgi:hypothetical protein